MHQNKDKFITMKRLLLILFGLICLHVAIGQSLNNDTISTIYSKVGTISKDTNFLDFPTGVMNLTRYFNRNMRGPYLNDSAILGSCNLYLIVDKAGYVTQAWYDQTMNNDIGATQLERFKLYPRFKPTYIGKEPVITKVMIRVVVIYNEAISDRYNQSDYKADIILVSYGVQHKQDSAAF